MASPQSSARRRAVELPADPHRDVSVEILDEHGLPLLIMPAFRALGLGLRFRKAVTALYVGERVYVQTTHPAPKRRESRREILDLFVAPVPAGLAPEDVAAEGPAAALGYEPAVRFVAELPPDAHTPVSLCFFTARLSQGAEALPAGKGLLPLDPDELYGLTAQAPEQFSAELLRVLKAGLLFPKDAAPESLVP